MSADLPAPGAADGDNDDLFAPDDGDDGLFATLDADATADDAPPPPPRAPRELVFMRRLMVALGAVPGLRVWRQNVAALAVQDPRTRRRRVLRAGAPKGAADLTGLAAPWGTRVEIECKRAAEPLTPEQRRWERFVRAAGGVHVVARAWPDAPLAANVAAAVDLVRAALAARHPAAAADHREEPPP